MDKAKLKDIILKTLEKEGGAAGLKALAKAAKTSKGKLKKDLDNMGGVKQHKHGDYISTPLKEKEKKCKCKNGVCITAGGNLCPSHECEGACRGSDSKLKEITPLVKMGKKAFGKLASKIFGSPADYSNTYYEQLNEIKDIIEVMLDEKKKKKKDRCHRKADQVYGTKTSAYKSGAIVKCRKGMIWKKK